MSGGTAIPGSLGHRRLAPGERSRVAARRRTRTGWSLALALLVVAGLALLWAVLPVEAWIADFRHWLAGFGAWAPVLAVLAYMAGSVLMLPGSAMTVTTALVFGFWAIPLVMVGATLGGALAFLVSRHLVRRPVERMVARRRPLRAVVRAVEARGGTVVLLLRLSPLVPFNVQNYLLGATGIPLWRFMAATAVGVLPGTAMFVYLVSIGRGGGERSPWEWALLLAGLVATVAVAVIVGRRAKAELAREGLSGKETGNAGSGAASPSAPSQTVS
ncbi:MAG TPA: TVP38/TMEM64 family protein [Azospirillaceae bacterium]|nr:TVP38/TMEM64 family protein [Azospirillaceae bacterium]